MERVLPANSGRILLTRGLDHQLCVFAQEMVDGPVTAAYQVVEGSGGEVRPSATPLSKGKARSPLRRSHSIARPLSTGAVTLVVKLEQLQRHVFPLGG